MLHSLATLLSPINVTKSNWTVSVSWGRIACVYIWWDHPLGLRLCSSPPHSFYPSFLYLSFSLTSISPLQPEAPSNRPLLCWLDFSLVNSPRLSVTSSGSLPTDYTNSLFLNFFPSSSSSSSLLEVGMAWHWCDVSCWIRKPTLPDRLRVHHCRAIKILLIYFWVLLCFYC